ncbi:MAG: GGDEF domain-containing protein [Eubacterium sp.]|nr:GGDEF domain-containing protein [Eubacterium sp.]
MKKYRGSLKTKTMLVMIAAFTIVGIASVLLFYKGVRDIARSEYMSHCYDLASTVARSLDVSQVEAVNKEVMGIYRGLDKSECMLSEQEDQPGYYNYLANYSHVKDMKEFESLRNSLRRSQDVAHVECLYIIYPDIETHRIIYLVDGAYEDIWQPGTLEVLYDTDFREEGNIDSGFGSLLSDADDGSLLVTTAMPIYDDNNNLIAYAGLDYSIQSLLEDQRHYVIIAIIMIGLLAAISAFIVIQLVDRSIVKPINALSDASVRFYNNESDNSDDAHAFSDLNIHTGDEIETLAESMAKMEKDIDDHIEALLTTKRELSSTKEYAEEMARNANKDPLTGVKNKRAYETALEDLRKEIAMNVARFGIVVIDLNDLKAINDNYGHEAGDDAIKQICGIICEVFKHSPVFRYGGDEFVVILHNQDLNNIENLIRRFRSEIDEIKSNKKADPWLRHDAAIGYAFYSAAMNDDPESVFERADQAMYKNKLKIKSLSEQH